MNTGTRVFVSPDSSAVVTYKDAGYYVYEISSLISHNYSEPINIINS